MNALAYQVRNLKGEHRTIMYWLLATSVKDQLDISQKQLEHQLADPTFRFTSKPIKWSVKRLLDKHVSATESATWSRRMRRLVDLNLVHKEGALVRLTQRGRAYLYQDVREIMSFQFASGFHEVQGILERLEVDYQRDQAEAILKAIEIAEEHGFYLDAEALRTGLYQRLISPFRPGLYDWFSSEQSDVPMKSKG